MTEKLQGVERLPIDKWHVAHTMPEGNRIPIDMRDALTDIPLPVRRSNDLSADSQATEPPDVVCVEYQDAIKALDLAGREDAAAWWRTWCDELSIPPSSPLMFLVEEGQLMSAAEAAQAFPSTVQFELINT